jgi:hypothetical protein
MAWNPPSQGTNKREAMPSSCFLVPGEKKYPWKVKRNGQWVPSKQGLMAALHRAAQQGDASVEAKARRLLKTHFGYTSGN